MQVFAKGSLKVISNNWCHEKHSSNTVDTPLRGVRTGQDRANSWLHWKALPESKLGWCKGNSSRPKLRLRVYHFSVADHTRGVERFPQEIVLAGNSNPPEVRTTTDRQQGTDLTQFELLSLTCLRFGRFSSVVFSTFSRSLWGELHCFEVEKQLT